MSNTVGAEALDNNGPSNGGVIEPRKEIFAAPAQEILGAWRLLSIEDRRENGEIVYWMGRKPTGLIIYDASGYMSVQFMRDPRPVFTTTYSQAAPEEVRNAYQGYFAYFGTYEVNAEKRLITHHLRGSLRPEEVGIDYDRYFQIEGDCLILTMMVPGKDTGRSRALKWARCPAASV
jgi:Lipocalin-like domain